MCTEQKVFIMSFPSYVLRLFPAILPLAVASSAIAGLASRLGTIPNTDNVIFVLVAASISGIIPLCVLLGAAFMGADIYRHSRWPYCLATIAAIVLYLVLVGGYKFGQNLDF